MSSSHKEGRIYATADQCMKLEITMLSEITQSHVFCFMYDMGGACKWNGDY